MKRDFLKNLGIEDKEIIDKIMDENSADIGKAKGELQTYKDKVASLENDIKTKDNEIQTLQNSKGDVDALREQIAQLETDKTNLTNELNTKVAQLQKDYAIEGAIRDAKAKNVKAVKALLDADKVTYENDQWVGISDQLEALKGDENTSFLFGDNSPAGTKLVTPPANGGNPPTATTLAEAVAKAFNTNK